MRRPAQTVPTLRLCQFRSIVLSLSKQTDTSNKQLIEQRTRRERSTSPPKLYLHGINPVETSEASNLFENSTAPIMSDIYSEMPQLTPRPAFIPPYPIPWEPPPIYFHGIRPDQAPAEFVAGLPVLTPCPVHLRYSEESKRLRRQALLFSMQSAQQMQFANPIEVTQNSVQEPVAAAAQPLINNNIECTRNVQPIERAMPMEVIQNIPSYEFEQPVGAAQKQATITHVPSNKVCSRNEQLKGNAAPIKSSDLKATAAAPLQPLNIKRLNVSTKRNQQINFNAAENKLLIAPGRKYTPRFCLEKSQAAEMKKMEKDLLRMKQSFLNKNKKEYNNFVEQGQANPEQFIKPFIDAQMENIKIERKLLLQYRTILESRFGFQW